MISSPFPGSACLSSSPRAKHGPGFNPIAPTFTSFGRYADVGSQRIKSSHPGLLLHVGSTSTLYLKKGTLLGRDITYLSQAWNVWDAESMQVFYEQVLPYIHPETLRPLMGICAPTVIGLYNAAAGRLSLAMELPHPIGWREADPHISAELKEKIITAYQNIHSHNILHNDVKLENILIGNDDKVTIVDFCKMVVNPEPADLALEMRAVNFTLNYDGAKKIEYGRLRRAESRIEKNLWRSRLRRTAESQELAEEVEPDEPPSQDEIAFPPFSSLCLARWDCESATEGTTHCSGWRGRRFEVPEDMQNPPWPGVEDYTPPTPPPYQPVDFADLVERAFGRKSFTSHSQWMEHCHYFPYLWSPPLESVAPSPKESGGTSSSSTSPSGSSDYGRREYGSTTDAESSKRNHSPTPPFIGKRLRTAEFARPDDCSYRNKRARRSRSLESVVEYEVDPASWATRRVGELGSPSSSPKLKGREREPTPLAVFPLAIPTPETDLLTPTSLSPDCRKSNGSAATRTTSSHSRNRPVIRSHQSSPAQSTHSSLRTSVAASPGRKSERKCSVVVKNGDEEDKVWLMSEEVLQDVKGYLQVKKAAGAAVEVHSGGEEGGVRHSHPRAEKALRPSPTRSAKKRSSSPEDNSKEAQKRKRRRSWPDTNPYVSEPRTGSLPCSD